MGCMNSKDSNLATALSSKEEWESIKKKLTFGKTRYDSKRRDRLWETIDRDLSGALSFAEIEKAAMSQLQLDKVLSRKQLAPILVRAFNAAKVTSRMKLEGVVEDIIPHREAADDDAFGTSTFGSGTKEAANQKHTQIGNGKGSSQHQSGSTSASLGLGNSTTPSVPSSSRHQQHVVRSTQKALASPADRGALAGNSQSVSPIVNAALVSPSNTSAFHPRISRRPVPQKQSDLSHLRSSSAMSNRSAGGYDQHQQHVTSQSPDRNGEGGNGASRFAPLPSPSLMAANNYNGSGGSKLPFAVTAINNSGELAGGGGGIVSVPSLIPAIVPAHGILMDVLVTAPTGVFIFNGSAGSEEDELESLTAPQTTSRPASQMSLRSITTEDGADAKRQDDTNNNNNNKSRINNPLAPPSRQPRDGNNNSISRSPSRNHNAFVSVVGSANASTSKSVSFSSNGDYTVKKPVALQSSAALNLTATQKERQYNQLLREEFRLFLMYIADYMELYFAFEMIDTSGDKKVSLEEFVAAVPLLRKWGIGGLGSDDPSETKSTIVSETQNKNRKTVETSSRKATNNSGDNNTSVSLSSAAAPNTFSANSVILELESHALDVIPTESPEALFQSIDTSGNGTLTFREFSDWAIMEHLRVVA